MIVPFISIIYLGFHLCQSLCYIQTDLVIEVSIVDLLRGNYLSHLTGIASSLEVDEDHYAIHCQNQTDTEKDNEVGLGSGPGDEGSSLKAMT